MPFDEYEAENAVINGTMIGPDRTFTSLPAEASGLGLGAPAVRRCNRDFRLIRVGNDQLEGESGQGCPP